MKYFNKLAGAEAEAMAQVAKAIAAKRKTISTIPEGAKVKRISEDVVKRVFYDILDKHDKIPKGHVMKPVKIIKK